eukprot:1161047-Pelagomonas_calceolata.AAC.39
MHKRAPGNLRRTFQTSTALKQGHTHSGATSYTAPPTQTCKKEQYSSGRSSILEMPPQSSKYFLVMA